MPPEMEGKVRVVPEGDQKDLFIKKTGQKFRPRTHQHRGGKEQKWVCLYLLRQQKQAQRAKPIDGTDG